MLNNDLAIIILVVYQDIYDCFCIYVTSNAYSLLLFHEHKFVGCGRYSSYHCMRICYYYDNGDYLLYFYGFIIRCHSLEIEAITIETILFTNYSIYSITMIKGDCD